jgi:hypothetical protein
MLWSQRNDAPQHSPATTIIMIFKQVTKRSRFQRAIHSLLKTFASTKGVEPPAARPFSMPIIGTAESRRFDDQLEAIAQNRTASTPMVAGSIQLVTLSGLREELGSMWPALAKRGFDIAAEEIKRELEPADLFRPHEDNTFLVCFANLSMAEAKAKAARISQRIRSRLIAEVPQASGRILVDRFVTEVDGQSVLGGGQPVADALQGSLMRIRSEAAQNAKLGRESFLRDVRVLFQPIWHVRRSRSSMNRCLLDPISGSTTIAHLETLSSSHEATEAIARIDCLLLTKSLEGLHDALSHHAGRAEVLVPVHFSTLYDASSDSNYLDLLEMLPAQYRSHVALEIHGVPASAEVLEVLDILDRLQPFAAKVILQMSPLDPRLGAMMDSVLWGLSVDLSRWRDNLAMLPTWLPSFVRAATEKGLKSVAHGADSLGLAEAARGGGFNFISGSAIHLTSDTPKPPAFLNPLLGWEQVSRRQSVWTARNPLR